MKQQTLNTKHLNLMNVVLTVQTHFLGIVSPKLRKLPLSLFGIFGGFAAVDIPLWLEEAVRLLVVTVVSRFRRERPEREGEKLLVSSRGGLVYCRKPF
uniref:Uncharacterized protein n=1 Tax=Brassica campestris TaxID=3711 RepID=M4F4Z5_BRACM